MFIKFDEVHDYGLGQVEAVRTATASTTKGFQAILSEAIDYSKKSFENHQGFVDKLLRVRSPDELFELQSNHAKASFDEFAARAGKIRELYSEVSKEAFGALLNGVSKSEKEAPAKAVAPLPTRKASVAAAE
jgi:hypothetical protein